jgi:two-component system OmpR family sensor kinase
MKARGSWSLSRRLVVSLTLSLGTLWLVAAGLASWAAVHETNEVFDSALQETAQRLLTLAVDDIDDLIDDRDHDRDHDDFEVQDTLPAPDHKEYLTYQFRDRSGRVLLRSHDAPEAPFPVPLAHGFAESAGQRVYTEPSPDGALFIQVAEKESHRYHALLHGVASLIIPLLLLLPLAGLIIWRTVARGVRPLRALREEIAARGGSNLAPLPGTGLPDELTPIVRDVNRLIERLGSALEAERAFAANSAHEMRTPVAATLAQVQRLGAELAGSPQQTRIQAIEDSLRRLASLVAKLLQLSRADSGVAATSEAADLLPIMELVIDEFARMPATAGRIDFQPGATDRMAAQIDIDAFAIVFRNLLENALLHGERTQPVRISIAGDRGIHVASGGPPVPPDVLHRLTQRFVRGDTAAGGSGLGLAIAEKILRQAGGKLELHSPALGRADGFEAVIRLP